MAKITVYVADPLAIFREGIYVALTTEDDIDMVGATGVYKEAERFIKSNPPDIVILYTSIGKLNGLEIARRIKRKLLQVRVILILEDEDDRRIFAAIKSGVSACITRDIDPEHLVTSIKEVAEGYSPISRALLRPAIATRVLDEFQNILPAGREDTGAPEGLTDTEAEILRHAAEGSTATGLMTTLALSRETLDTQLARILSKTGSQLAQAWID